MVGGPALAAQPDPRRRGHVKADSIQGGALSVSRRIRIHHLLALLLTKTLLASAAWLARQWLLVSQIDIDACANVLREIPNEKFDVFALAQRADIVHAPASLWAVATVTMCTASFLLLLAFRVWRWQVMWTDHTVRHLFMLGVVQFAQLLLWLTALKYTGATVYVWALMTEPLLLRSSASYGCATCSFPSGGPNQEGLSCSWRWRWSVDLRGLAGQL